MIVEAKFDPQLRRNDGHGAAAFIAVEVDIFA